MVGNVQYLSEELGEVPESLIVEISEEYSTFLKQLATVAGGWNRTINVTSDPVYLAREAIATMAASIEIPKLLCQKLLENSAVARRLETVLPLLKQGNELMQEKVEDSNPFKGARLN